MPRPRAPRTAARPSCAQAFWLHRHEAPHQGEREGEVGAVVHRRRRRPPHQREPVLLLRATPQRLQQQHQGPHVVEAAQHHPQHAEGPAEEHHRVEHRAAGRELPELLGEDGEAQQVEEHGEEAQALHGDGGHLGHRGQRRVQEHHACRVERGEVVPVDALLDLPGHRQLARGRGPDRRAHPEEGAGALEVREVVGHRAAVELAARALPAEQRPPRAQQQPQPQHPEGRGLHLRIRTSRSRACASRRRRRWPRPPRASRAAR